MKSHNIFFYEINKLYPEFSPFNSLIFGPVSWYLLLSHTSSQCKVHDDLYRIVGTLCEHEVCIE